MPAYRHRAGDAGHPLHAQRQAGIDAANAAMQGPPCPVSLENARQLAETERLLFGRVRTRELR